MALSILDGTQTATTLSTILSSGQHITAHTVVSLGTQAITDILNATSAGLTNTQLRASAVTIGGTVTIGNSVTISSLPAISGTVTVGNTVNFLSGSASDGNLSENIALAMISNNILGITNALPAGTNRIGVVTIGAGTVTIGAGTAQIGSVTASISGTVPISISSITVGNSVTIGSLPAISGTVTANVLGYNYQEFGIAQIPVKWDYNDNNYIPIGPSLDPIPLPISGTVTANTFAVQGTAVTTSNFTSITPSTVLANFNATREVLTIFNEGAGNLHLCAGATCTTIAYQVRLSAGDYYEVPNHQTTITHSAVFATAGTARVTELT
jgi:hypothetical protein